MDTERYQVSINCSFFRCTKMNTLLRSINLLGILLGCAPSFFAAAPFFVKYARGKFLLCTKIDKGGVSAYLCILGGGQDTCIEFLSWVFFVSASQQVCIAKYGSTHGAGMFLNRNRLWRWNEWAGYRHRMMVWFVAFKAKGAVSYQGVGILVRHPLVPCLTSFHAKDYDMNEHCRNAKVTYCCGGSLLFFLCFYDLDHTQMLKN